MLGTLGAAGIAAIEGGGMLAAIWGRMGRRIRLRKLHYLDLIHAARITVPDRKASKMAGMPDCKATAGTGPNTVSTYK